MAQIQDLLLLKMRGKNTDRHTAQSSDAGLSPYLESLYAR
jgi:hypothetical protein